MPRQKPTDQIATIKKQQAELAARLKEISTREREEAKEKQKRKNELAGGLALGELSGNPSSSFALALVELLKAGLTRSVDRALFDLPPLAKEQKPKGDKTDTQAEAPSGQSGGQSTSA